LKSAIHDISKKIKKDKKTSIQKEEDSSDGMIQLPAIFIDIDGVVIKGTGTGGIAIDVIEGADKALRRVMKTTYNGAKIPFAFMTNGGMETEQQKADKMNTLLKFTPEEA
jgi:ribonucleotide monophosphatase NagD (HAD superfamily)